MSDRKMNASIVGGTTLALLGASCCALPIALVALGLGGVVASTVSVLPWLNVLAQYKLITFSMTALTIAYSWWRIRKAGQCDLEQGRMLRAQRIVLRVITAIFGASLFAAYLLYPLTLFLENSGW